MPAVEDTLVTRDDAVRHWGTLLFAIMDYETPIPDELFGEDRLPIALPDLARDLGFITTDGVSNADELSSDPTTMLQQLQPVRTDLTGRERSLTVAFGEANAWVNALYHLKRVADFPADKFGAWDFSDDDEEPDSPWYRFLIFGQDGVGPQAVYRMEAAYRAKVTAKTERTLARQSETFGFTFGLFKDPVSGLTYRRAQDSPSYAQPPVGG